MRVTNVTIETSDSGRIIRFTHENGRIIAEIYVHGPFKNVLENCDQNLRITNGRANIFRGELFGLAGYEILDLENERITER